MTGDTAASRAMPEMRMSSAKDDIAYLESVVPIMRRLQILEFRDVKLAPLVIDNQNEEQPKREPPVKRRSTGGLVPMSDADPAEYQSR